MPSVQSICHPDALALHIADSLSHFHVRGGLLACIEWFTNCARVAHSKLERNVLAGYEFMGSE